MSTFLNDLRLEEIGSGERSGTWGTATNTNLSIIAEAFSYGTETIGDANTTITMADNCKLHKKCIFAKITKSFFIFRPNFSNNKYNRSFDIRTI